MYPWIQKVDDKGVRTGDTVSASHVLWQEQIWKFSSCGWCWPRNCIFKTSLRFAFHHSWRRKVLLKYPRCSHPRTHFLYWHIEEWTWLIPFWFRNWVSNSILPRVCLSLRQLPAVTQLWRAPQSLGGGRGGNVKGTSLHVTHMHVTCRVSLCSLVCVQCAVYYV